MWRPPSRCGAWSCCVRPTWVLTGWTACSSASPPIPPARGRSCTIPSSIRRTTHWRTWRRCCAPTRTGACKCSAPTRCRRWTPCMPTPGRHCPGWPVPSGRRMCRRIWTRPPPWRWSWPVPGRSRRCPHWRTAVSPRCLGWRVSWLSIPLPAASRSRRHWPTPLPPSGKRRTGIFPRCPPTGLWRRRWRRRPPPWRRLMTRRCPVSAACWTAPATGTASPCSGLTASAPSTRPTASAPRRSWHGWRRR